MVNKYFTYIGIVLVAVTITVNARVYLVKDDTQAAVNEIRKILGKDVSREYSSAEWISRKKKRIKVALHPNSGDSNFTKKLLASIKNYYNRQNSLKYPNHICNRHFGSIYGTKYQREKCIRDYLEEKHTAEESLEASSDNSYLDETRSTKFKRNVPSLHIKNIESTDFMVFIIRGVPTYRKTENFNEDRFSLDYYDDTRKFMKPLYEEDVDYESDDESETNSIIKKNVNSENSNEIDDSTEEVNSETERYVMKNRFEVVDSLTKSKSNNKWKYMQNYEDSSSIESIETTPKPKKKRKKKRHTSNEVLYMQGPQRVVHSDSGEVSDNSEVQYRKYSDRLPHFMPKTYFWHEDDFHRLGYFWFDGAQGLVAHGRRP